MVLKTDESEGKILKICIKIKKISEKFRKMFRVRKHFLLKIILKIKKILKSLEILFRVWKHIFDKNYFENQKNSEKFRNNV